MSNIIDFEMYKQNLPTLPTLVRNDELGKEISVLEKHIRLALNGFNQLEKKGE